MPKKTKDKYPEIKEIREDLESLKDNTVELAQHVKKDGMEQVQETKQTLTVQALKNLKQIEKQVQRKPMQSIAVAFAGGLVASMFLRGRR